MNTELTSGSTGRWALLIALTVVCLIAALALAFGGYLVSRAVSSL